MKNYKAYRWFFTSSGALVVGGKNADQNDSLIKYISKKEENFWVLHTSDPGSSFCVIIKDSEKVTKKDIAETAIFCGSFSQAWKKNKNKTNVDIFMSVQVFKEKGMKAGTWGVSGQIKKISAPLELVLTKQNNIYRAVPEKSVIKKDILLFIKPGKINKERQINELMEKLMENKKKKDELLSALPAGGLDFK